MDVICDGFAGKRALREFYELSMLFCDRGQSSPIQSHGGTNSASFITAVILEEIFVQGF